MRTAAIIQARMKSTRLPGKVLMPIAGRPLLEHIVRRLRRCWTLTEIAVATSLEPEDDAIVRFCQEAQVKVFRGPEDNVLERIAIAARALDPDVLVRVTGDSPLIDPEIVDRLVCEMARQGADFVTLKAGVTCIQEGVDPFSRRALRVLLGEAGRDPVAREHVTGWLKAHPERVRVATIDMDPGYVFSGARLSVDTPADLEFFAALAARVDLDRVSLREVADLLRREPWLMTINAHVRQKPAAQREATVLLRADGGGALGFGHLTRMAALAEALRDREGVGAIVLTGAHAAGDAAAARQFLEERKIPVVAAPVGVREIDFILETARRRKAGALVLDIRTGLTAQDLEGIRAAGIKIITMDDASDRRLIADIAVFPPVPQAAALNWREFGGECVIGPEWIPLAPDVARLAGRAQDTRGSRLLISMGGSDPLRLTEPIARACAQAIDAPIDAIIGPGYAEAEAVAGRLNRLRNVTADIAPADPAGIFARARLAIASFGVTAYELAALGVPALYVALSEDHRRSAEGAEALGFGRVATTADALDAEALARTAAELWKDPARLAAMSRAGQAAIDGEGAARLARKIVALIRAPAAEPTESRRRAQTSLPSRRPAAGG